MQVANHTWLLGAKIIRTNQDYNGNEDRRTSWHLSVTNWYRQIFELRQTTTCHCKNILKIYSKFPTPQELTPEDIKKAEIFWIQAETQQNMRNDIEDGK